MNEVKCELRIVNCELWIVNEILKFVMNRCNSSGEERQLGVVTDGSVVDEVGGRGSLRLVDKLHDYLRANDMERMIPKWTFRRELEFHNDK